jgi:hypothetical protein
MPTKSPQKALLEMFELRYGVDLAADIEHVLIPAAIQAHSKHYEAAAELVRELIPDHQEKVEFLVAENYLIDPREPLTANSPVMMHIRRWTALVTTDDEMDRPIRAAFKKAGLDETNPIHWHILLALFARAHFGPKAKRGAPTQWTSTRYCQLLYDAHQVKKQHPNFSINATCKSLLKKQAYWRQGRKLSMERLRKALREAKQPKYNAILKSSIERRVAMMRDRHLQANVEWTPQISSVYEKNVRGELLNWIGNNWADYIAKTAEFTSANTNLDESRSS